MTISFGHFWYGSRKAHNYKSNASISTIYTKGFTLRELIDKTKRILILNKLNIKR